MTRQGRNYPHRVIGSTDVYSRKHLDRQYDRLDRLHDVHSKKIGDLKLRIVKLEEAVGKHLKEQ